MEKQFDAGEFLRQLYLNAEPGIDLSTVEGPINPSHYHLKISELERIEAEYDIQAGTDLAVGVAFLVLNKGPQLVEG